MKRFSTIIVFVFIASAIWSQVPKKINYQAVVRSVDGEIVKNKDVSMRISLHSGSLDGATLYSETHSLSTNEFGLVNLAIGQGQSANNFSEIEWGTGTGIWVKIELDSQGGTSFVQMGGMELMSVPYAMYAGEAGKASAVLQCMTNEERLAMSAPAIGTMILNTSTGKINICQTDGWYELGGEKISSSFSCGQHLIDPRDQKSYKTVQIGEQCWMAENLNVGDMVLGSVDMTDNEQIEKYCYGDAVSACDTYGGLYQWDELMQYTKQESSQGICPDGWHIPSDMEVQELEIALGMDASLAALTNVWRGSDEGEKMSMGGSSGYEALLSGRRVTGGLYSAIESYEYLYTSSESGPNAWRRCLRVNDPRIGRYNTFPKTYGMSVRCVLNK